LAAAPPYVPLAWEEVPCPFCGSDDASLYERFGSALQYTYVLCRRCRLVYSSPRPRYDAHFVEAAYASYYQLTDTVALGPDTLVRESSVPMFREEVAHLVQFDARRSAVLDVGSGMGTFLFAAKPLYEEAVGLDVSPRMAAFVEAQLGVRVHLDRFEDFVHPRKFSLIHMSHVLEHVPDPNRWLRKAASLLDDGGILAVNVPNKFSAGARVQHLAYRLRLKRQFQRGWSDPARTPDHLFEPTLPSMRFLLARNGYEILDHHSYSRRDPASRRTPLARLVHRGLKVGSNLAFVARPRRAG
jgi:SAM-dependent methyltransferase